MNLTFSGRSISLIVIKNPGFLHLYNILHRFVCTDICTNEIHIQMYVFVSNKIWPLLSPYVFVHMNLYIWKVVRMAGLVWTAKVAHDCQENIDAECDCLFVQSYLATCPQLR